MGKKSGSESGMNKKKLFWVKIPVLKFFDTDPGWKKFGSGIRDGKKSDPGSGMEKSRIRDKHPGSATLPLTHL
jgi:hypothetical protein